MGVPVVVLLHGTTRQRAEAILKNGPDINFREKGEYTTAMGFSTLRAIGPYWYGSPEDYAVQKATNFPGEGGPAILEMEVPETLVVLADLVSEVRFEPGFGLEELLQVWPSLTKRIVVP